tara:strand:+ start:109 stop:246 length:138 start_codon:yes stop_codon:yes gene_type:complete
MLAWQTGQQFAMQALLLQNKGSCSGSFNLLAEYFYDFTTKYQPLS